jgi:NADPH-dependent glutamate synthase beta subunit-like oxidoreductase
MHSEQAPSCTSACPVHVDARKLTEYVSRGDFQGGLAALANAVPLPRILAHICDHPCQAQCKRAEAGEAIEIGLLEWACADRFVEWFEAEYTARFGGVNYAEIVQDDMRNKMARCPAIVMESLQ